MGSSLSSSGWDGEHTRVVRPGPGGTATWPLRRLRDEWRLRAHAGAATGCVYHLRYLRGAGCAAKKGTIMVTMLSRKPHKHLKTDSTHICSLCISNSSNFGLHSFWSRPRMSSGTSRMAEPSWGGEPWSRLTRGGLEDGFSRGAVEADFVRGADRVERDRPYSLVPWNARVHIHATLLLWCFPQPAASTRWSRRHRRQTSLSALPMRAARMPSTGRPRYPHTGAGGAACCLLARRRGRPRGGAGAPPQRRPRGATQRPSQSSHHRHGRGNGEA